MRCEDETDLIHVDPRELIVDYNVTMEKMLH